ncbi:hypothetical protein ZYGR_0AK04350 [Zygosaccharomyces rouxii]|uniref:Acyl-coenzyme A diphosphatase YFT2 n=1 Tax=Zygosaccharomyces rouxii TaxID=4956 RepID=A0A1Q3AEN1_ZYGRO|nr:hypothetical protein ZYGR_0AK04350 [Zygosaccharomyces rouxii]
MRLVPLDWKKAATVYPIELVVGCTIALLMGNERLEWQKREHYFLNPKNFLNELFAYHGNQIWTILFCGLAGLQWYLKTHIPDVIPRDVRTIVHNPTTSLIKQYIVKLILKNILLAVLFFFIDGIFILTGGSCSDHSGTYSAEKCRQNGAQWEGGFDISGHFCFLVNISMILWFELQHLKSWLIEEDMIKGVNVWCKAIIGTTIFTLATWNFILVITSIYYHKILEKVLGCAMGYVCPLIMYWLIPAHDNVRKILY